VTFGLDGKVAMESVRVTTVTLKSFGDSRRCLRMVLPTWPLACSLSAEEGAWLSARSYANDGDLVDVVGVSHGCRSVMLRLGLKREWR